MAVISYEVLDSKWIGREALVIRWPGLSKDDVGAPFRLPFHADITVQLTGVLGDTPGILEWEGTIDPADVPAAYGVLNFTIPGGIAQQTLVGQVNQVMEHPLQIRPLIEAGDDGSGPSTATNIDAYLIAVRPYKE